MGLSIYQPNGISRGLELRDQVMHEIAAIGEVLWDVFPSGPRFGGAPANFACSFAGLANAQPHRQPARVSMVSAVGQDQLGADALVSLQQHRVETACVRSLVQATGQVLIQLNEDGSANYEFASDCAWDNLGWSPALDELVLRTDVVCFGTLGQRSALARQTIQRFVSETSDDTMRIFDINLRPPFYRDEVILESLKLANVLKLNEEELPVLAKLCGLNGSDIDQLQQLSSRFQLPTIALTRGANGAILLHDGQIDQQASVKTTVLDTVGAGDAYTATLAWLLLNETNIETINRHACEVAAFVCSQAGATPAIPSEIVAKLQF